MGDDNYGERFEIAMFKSGARNSNTKTSTSRFIVF